MNTTLGLPFARIEELEARVKELEAVCMRDRFADGYAAGCKDFQMVGGKRIEELEADLAQWVRQAEDNSGGWQRACLRIEALEAALRLIIMKGDERAEEIARAALDEDDGK